MQNHLVIGHRHDVAISVAAWNGASAPVDLSCVCMFTHEVPDTGMRGGLLSLDQALEGKLSGLRTEGAFTANPMETVLLDNVSTAVASGAILVIGLGSPDQWKPSITASAVALAFQVAVSRKAATVAFAPSLLDAGIEHKLDVASVMMKGLVKEIDTCHRLSALGIAKEMHVKHWTFDASAKNLDSAQAGFHEAFASV